MITREDLLPLARIYTKLQNWGRVELHRENGADDPFAASASMVPSCKGEARDGSRVRRVHDHLPQLQVDHIDCCILIKNYLSELGESCLPATKLRPLLRWRFVEGKPTESYPAKGRNAREENCQIVSMFMRWATGAIADEPAISAI